MPRPRKPDALKLLRGTYQPCRQKQAAAPNGDIGAPPDYLNDGERRCWQEFTAMAPTRSLGAADEFILATTCRLESEYREKGAGMPASKIGLLLKCLGKLGLNPTDRANVTALEPETPNPYDEF